MYVINKDRVPRDVSVLFGETLVVLLFLDEDVSVAVLILDQIEDRVSPIVFV